MKKLSTGCRRGSSYLVLGLVFALMLVLFTNQVFACTNVIVGKDATVDGSTISTYSCDGARYAVVHVVPEENFSPSAVMPIYFRPFPLNYQQYLKYSLMEPELVGEIPQVENTYRYVSIEVWYDHQHVGGINEHGVTVGETTIPGREELRNDKGLLGAYTNFKESSLMTLALQRAKTAREAVKIMGSLAEEYGYYAPMGSEHITVADGDEAWAFEVFGGGADWTPDSDEPGAVWCAQRIPDDQIGVSANRSRIGEIDLDDPDHFMCSSNVFSLAEEMGWWDPSGDEPFVWYEAYGPSTRSNSSLREWAALNKVAPSLGLDPEADRYPFSVKPDQPVSVKDIMAIHRDTLEGTLYDITEDPAFLVNGKKSPMASPWGPRELHKLLGVKPKRSIATSRSVFSYISQVRNWLPKPVKGVMWFGFGPAATTTYVPIYSGVTELSESWGNTDLNRINREQAWWAFNLVSELSLIEYQNAITDIRAVSEPAEARFFDIQPHIESKAVDLYINEGEAASRELVTDYTNLVLDEVFDSYWNLVDYLLFKYYFTASGSANPLRPTITLPSLESLLAQSIKID